MISCSIDSGICGSFERAGNSVGIGSSAENNIKEDTNIVRGGKCAGETALCRKLYQHQPNYTERELDRDQANWAKNESRKILQKSGAEHGIHLGYVESEASLNKASRWKIDRREELNGQKKARKSMIDRSLLDRHFELLC